MDTVDDLSVEVIGMPVRSTSVILNEQWNCDRREFQNEVMERQEATSPSTDTYTLTANSTIASNDKNPSSFILLLQRQNHSEHSSLLRRKENFITSGFLLDLVFACEESCLCKFRDYIAV
jgi:hypothetical protein